VSEIEIYTMGVAAAQRLTERIRITAQNAREAIEKLQELVTEAKEGNAHVVLNYPSWTAYLADVLGEHPLRLDRHQRKELVGYLAGEGMSTRAIAPIVGVTHKTIHNDIVKIREETPTGEKSPTERESFTGLDGRVYKGEPKTQDAKKPNRRALSESARDAGWDLRKVVERLERIAADDRFAANKELMAPHLRSHLTTAIEVCQDLLDRITTTE
jgi:transposase